MEIYLYVFYWVILIMAFIYAAIGIYTIINSNTFRESVISVTQTYIAIFITICAISFIILSHVDTTDFAYSIYYKNQVKEVIENDVRNMFKGMMKKEIAKYLCQ